MVSSAVGSGGARRTYHMVTFTLVSPRIEAAYQSSDSMEAVPRQQQAQMMRTSVEVEAAAAL